MRLTSDHLEAALDAALELTFPASDPVAISRKESQRQPPPIA